MRESHCTWRETFLERVSHTPRKGQNEMRIAEAGGNSGEQVVRWSVLDVVIPAHEECFHSHFPPLLTFSLWPRLVYWAARHPNYQPDISMQLLPRYLKSNLSWREPMTPLSTLPLHQSSLTIYLAGKSPSRPPPKCPLNLFPLLHPHDRPKPGSHPFSSCSSLPSGLQPRDESRHAHINSFDGLPLKVKSQVGSVGSEAPWLACVACHHAHSPAASEA